MADLRHRRHRLRLRHLRTADAAADRRGRRSSSCSGAAPGLAGFNDWVGTLFYIPAFAGGIFGLLGGYLTDLFGRRRVLDLEHPALRVLGVRGRLLRRRSRCSSAALLRLHRRLRRVRRGRRLARGAVPRPEAAREGARLHPGVLVDRRPPGRDGQRPGASPTRQPRCDCRLRIALADPHAPWRYTLMSGIIPAIPLIVIRPFLPESPVWQRRRRRARCKRPSFAELFAPELRRTTIVTTMMIACAYAAAFGAIQQIPQHRARPAGSARDDAAPPRPAQEQTISARAVVPGVRRPGRPRRCSRFWRSSSSAGAGCCTCSRFPA